MNYIKQLQERIQKLEADRECAKLEAAAFRQHLHSAKFVGTEQRWVDCAACDDRHVIEERKDWISTADVLQRLQHIEQWFRD
jgi:hypothetical protein